MCIVVEKLSKMLFAPGLSILYICNVDDRFSKVLSARVSDELLYDKFLFYFFFVEKKV